MLPAPALPVTMKGSRVRRLAALVFLVVIGSACLVPDAGAQTILARFRIEAVKDTTFIFDIGRQNWVRQGSRGQAVDPARGDEFVAEFRVIGVQGASAEAVITGQTRRLLPEHVALMQPPRRPFWRQALFWIGAAGGAIVGLVAGSSI